LRIEVRYRKFEQLCDRDLFQARQRMTWAARDDQPVARKRFDVESWLVDPAVVRIRSARHHGSSDRRA
jgi:hypothetical protein